MLKTNAENSEKRAPSGAARPPKTAEGDEPVRLQKILASAGIGSRRACEAWIQAGRVRVNGQAVTDLGSRANLSSDVVTFDNRVVRLPSKRYYIALNKPTGVVCTCRDPHAARLVTDLVDLASRPMLRPVGRLDADSEGLIFLTDDGDFLHRLTHPRYHLPKTYCATVVGVPDQDALRKMTDGIVLDDGLTAPAAGVRIRRVIKETVPPQADVELTIFEGRNRQIRRMMSTLGHPVKKLVRIAIGEIRLTGIPSGGWRHLTRKEVEQLMKPAAAQISG